MDRVSRFMCFTVGLLFWTLVVMGAGSLLPTAKENGAGWTLLVVLALGGLCAMVGAVYSGEEPYK